MTLAISLHQPWASLIALGYKKYETRHWQTSYRGDLLICAAKKKSRSQQEFYRQFLFRNCKPYNHPPDWEYLPFGSVVAVCSLTGCLKMHLKNETPPHLIDSINIEDMTQMELDSGCWKSGRYAWRLENIRPLCQPVHIVGRQSLWAPSPQICDQASNQSYDLETESQIRNIQSSGRRPTLHHC
ncbi:hypothetical protein NIES4074_24190 [Cylindrospermum sp. NIES-4074]|nr:hypothetical protein NIES4074_24190 [Cylindrospermum sp. NIES-4074]